MPRGQLIQMIAMWVIIIAVFYFILIRPQKKKEKQLKDMRSAIAKGDVVVTIGGMVARVARVEEERIILELGPSRTKVPYEKWAIGKVIEKADKNDEVTEVADKLDE